MRRGVGYPIRDPTEVDRRRGRDMLQVSPWFPDVPRPAQPHAAHPLSVGAFYARPLIVQASKRFGLLALTSRH